MASEARYRPAAPSDGMGHIRLSDEQLASKLQLAKEADQYAASFLERREKCDYTIGVPDVRKYPRSVYHRSRGLCARASKLCAGIVRKIS
jgi:hypothetical protein